MGTGQVTGAVKVRDLSVNMSPDYTWSAHVAKVAAEGKKTLSWVLSVFRDCSKLTRYKIQCTC